jgi:hypothetical protein
MSGFRGSLEDLVVAHKTCQPDEKGGLGAYAWRMPEPHFHTRSGEIITSAYRGKWADESNNPWTEERIPACDHL